MTQQSTRSVSPRPDRRQRWFWSRCHFLLRFFGVLGLLALGVGLVLARAIPGFYSSVDSAHQIIRHAMHGIAPANLPSQIGVYGILGGGLAVLLALLVELLLLIVFVAARRSLMGFNAALQIALAAALLIGINVAAFWHPYHLDCTRAQEFTLPLAIENDLKKLTDDTTIVVYLPRVEPPGRSPNARRFDLEAERKVVEMVKDLVDQFRQVGPHFHVVVLDVGEEHYEDKLNQATEKAPKLRKAIEAAPENTIFFYQRENLQQLSFNEFLQLDKTASLEGRGNLVLLAQGGSSGRGVEPLADKILHIDERKPRVGILVIHELLTSESNDPRLTLNGLRKTLTEHGFEVTDVVLKKNWNQQRAPDAAADTLDESKLEGVESALQQREREIVKIGKDITELENLVDDWTLGTGENEAVKLESLREKYAGRRLYGGLVFTERLTPTARQELAEFFQRQLTQRRGDLVGARQDRVDLEKERERLDTDLVAEGRRMSDVHAKLKRAVADCDLLFIPRFTRVGLPAGEGIRHELHKLDDQQVAVVKEFLLSGRPVFACLGPINEPPQRGDLGVPAIDRDDNLEALFAELGIRFGTQTVLFPVDEKEFAQIRESAFTAVVKEKVPPIDFESPRQLGNDRWHSSQPGSFPQANPLREGLRVTARSVGGDFDLRIRFPRLVYYEPLWRWYPQVEAAGQFGLLVAPLNVGPLVTAANVPRSVRTDVVFQATGYGNANREWAPPAQVTALVGVLSCAAENGPLAALSGVPRTSKDSTFLLTGTGWNDDNPFSTATRLRPRYEAPDEKDPKAPESKDPATGTFEEKRRGQFSIGVAIERALPADWTPGTPMRVRVAAIGQGDVFVGTDLTRDKPANERLLLETVNWLVGRDAALPNADHAWRYPRIDMSETEKDLWLWGCRGALPAAFACLGVLVLLMRRLR